MLLLMKSDFELTNWIQCKCRSFVPGKSLSVFTPCVHELLRIQVFKVVDNITCLVNLVLQHFFEIPGKILLAL